MYCTVRTVLAVSLYVSARQSLSLRGLRPSDSISHCQWQDPYHHHHRVCTVSHTHNSELAQGKKCKHWHVTAPSQCPSHSSGFTHVRRCREGAPRRPNSLSPINVAPRLRLAPEPSLPLLPSHLISYSTRIGPGAPFTFNSTAPKNPQQQRERGKSKRYLWGSHDRRYRPPPSW